MTPRLRKENAAFQAVEGESDIEIHRDSGIYYVRAYRAGRTPLFKSLRTRKITEARALAKDEITAWLGRAPGLRPKRKKVRDLVPELLVELRKQGAQVNLDTGAPYRRKRTLDKDNSFLEKRREGKLGRHGERTREALLVELFGDLYPEEIDEAFWEDWVISEGRSLGRKLGDIAKYLSLLLSFAHRKKYVGRAPTIKNPDTHVKKSVVYEDSLLRKFHKAAEPTLKDLILIASENPIRPHENRECRWEFVRFIKQGPGPRAVVVNFPVWFAKNKECARELQLSPNAAEIYDRRYRANQKLEQPSPYVFPAPKNPEKPLSDVHLSRMWRRMLAQLKLEDSGYLFEWIRHSTYTKLIFDAKLAPQDVSTAGGTSWATLKKHYLTKDFRRTSAVGQAIRLDVGGEEE